MGRDIVFVTGFFGAPIMERALQLAAERGYDLLSLDEEIQRADGRTIRRLCMMMGEHEYRNKEYAQLKQIVEGAEGDQSDAAGKVESATDQLNATDNPAPITKKGLVVACGDGVLLDDMSAALMKEHEIVIAGTDMTIDALWQNAKDDRQTYHAFMHFGTDEKRRAAFHDLWKRQCALFASL